VSACTASPDEIEQTLDLSRAEVEIAISRLRLGIVGVMSAAIAAAVLMGNMPSLAPAQFPAPIPSRPLGGMTDAVTLHALDA